MCRSSGEENCAASGTFVRSRNRPGSRYNNLMMPCSAAAERDCRSGCSARAAASPSRAQQVALALLARAAEPPLALALHLVGHDCGGHARRLRDAHGVHLALDAAGQLGHHARRLLDEGHALLVDLEVVFSLHRAEPVVDVVFRLFEQVAECVRAEGLDIFVGVFRPCICRTRTRTSSFSRMPIARCDAFAPRRRCRRR